MHVSNLSLQQKLRFNSSYYHLYSFIHISNLLFILTIHSLATECFKEFLVRSRASNLQKHIEENNGWYLLEDESTFSDGLEIIVRSVNSDFRYEPLISLNAFRKQPT